MKTENIVIGALGLAVGALLARANNSAAIGTRAKAKLVKTNPWVWKFYNQTVNTGAYGSPPRGAVQLNNGRYLNLYDGSVTDFVPPVTNIFD